MANTARLLFSSFCRISQTFSIILRQLDTEESRMWEIVLAPDCSTSTLLFTSFSWASIATRIPVSWESSIRSRFTSILESCSDCRMLYPLVRVLPANASKPTTPAVILSGSPIAFRNRTIVFLLRHFLLRGKSSSSDSVEPENALQFGIQGWLYGSETQARQIHATRLRNTGFEEACRIRRNDISSQLC